VRILITGNLGYIGPSVTRRLRARYPAGALIGLDAGYFAHCLTNATSAPEANLDVQFFGDVRHPPPDVLQGVDAIVHLAAISNDPMGHAYEGATFDVNFRASVDLATRAKAAGVRAFVFASSCSVYGSSSEVARNELAAIDPLTAYAQTKVLAEQGLAELASPEFIVTCLRFATACGFSDRLRLDLVLNDFVASAIATGRITVLSDGSPWRPLIHVSDMARAIEWAIERTDECGGVCATVNAGSDEWNYRVRDLAYSVAAAIPDVDVSINRDAQPDKRSYRVDFSRFRQLAPDHQPQTTLMEAIDELRHGLEAMKFEDADFRSSPFMRLHVLAELQSRGLLSETLEWKSKHVSETALVA
jgi:nucleoside-diphosphate-sugar epimerase